MNYRLSDDGRIADHLSDGGRLISYAQTQERLIDAMDTWWRMPDRERGWQHVKAAWPDILRHGWRQDVDGEFDERAAITEPNRPAPTRDQIAAMIEASEWLALVDERDRRMVALVLALKARGVKKDIWVRVWKRLGRGKPGPDGLRKRYGTAISGVCQSLNARKMAENSTGTRQP